MQTIMVVGSGGREHAIIRKLRENENTGMIYVLPGNAGIERDKACQPMVSVYIPVNNLDAIIRFAKDSAVDFAIVSPEDPLCLGLVDMLEASGIHAFGPTKAAARIEGSKRFAKSFMRDNHIPTARYHSFEDVDAALAYARQSTLPIVVKADGLALGKGVTVAATLDEAETAIRDSMERGRFGEAGSTIIIEEYLQGVEASLLLFSDGHTYRLMPAAMDHKRIHNNDEGPNTGGMGTIAPHPLMTSDMLARVEREIVQPTLAGLVELGCPFKGCLFVGLMLTTEGPKVIEYNCRFGDPEAQSVLSLLESDLFHIMNAVRWGMLEKADVQFRQGAACCIVAASGGYPGSSRKGLPIEGLAPLLSHPNGDIHIDFMGVAEDSNGNIVTAGGRVLGVTAMADTPQAALDKAYAAIKTISFDGMQYRDDIGAKVLRMSADHVLQEAAHG